MEQATAASAPLPSSPATSRPPGFRAPRALQTFRFITDPVGFAEAGRRAYGDTFSARVFPAGEAVFVSDPDSLKRLFGADRVNTIAPGRNVVLEPLLGRRSVLLLEGSEHLQRRKLMLPQFHGERMRAYEDLIERLAEREVAAWPLGEELRLHPSMQAITLEVILSAVFGVGEERREDLRRRLIAILAATQSPAAIGMSFKATRWLPRYRRIRRLIAETDALLAAEIALRRTDPDLEAREDILSMLVAARYDDGEGMDDGEIRDQLMTLLMAGHETTATSLAWAFELLFRAPEAMERLRTEVQADGTEYLDAVVEETMRLRPVVPFTGRLLKEAAELGGYELPSGRVVFASIWLAHTRAATFPEPYAFRPERFLDGATETYSWIPFGGGTRRCLGASFALFEMKVALRTILRHAVLRPASDVPEPIVRRNVTLAPKHGTPAVLTERI
ncbi:MAG: cytochrome family [Solirubrobacterales bacterium]|nr:cytochrome family [Solirubrobacterales bacterium]